LRAAVLAGAAPAAMSRLTVTDDLTAGRLRDITVPGLDLRRQFRTIWRGGPTPPAGGVRYLLSHIGSRAKAKRNTARVRPLKGARSCSLKGTYNWARS
jgi:DNA-binding transcriptional LysR family regulator